MPHGRVEPGWAATVAAGSEAPVKGPIGRGASATQGTSIGRSSLAGDDTTGQRVPASPLHREKPAGVVRPRHRCPTDLEVAADAVVGWQAPAEAAGSGGWSASDTWRSRVQPTRHGARKVAAASADGSSARTASLRHPTSTRARGSAVRSAWPPSST